MHVCIYACMHAWLYESMHVCIHVCYICMYECMWACMYACMHAWKNEVQENDICNPICGYSWQLCSTENKGPNHWNLAVLILGHVHIGPLILNNTPSHSH